MPIELDTPTGTRTPVLRRRKLGETFHGALTDVPKQRDVLKRNDTTGADEPVLKPNGKRKQELVVTMVALPGCTMNAGLGDEESIPEPGDIVRVILKGGGYGAWIEADKALRPRQVGDIVTLTTTYGQAYDAQGSASGGHLLTQAEVDAIPRGRTVGLYGDLDIRRATTDEQGWVNAAEDAYKAANAIQLDATVAPDGPLAGLG